MHTVLTITGAASVKDSTIPIQGIEPGSNPRAALHSLNVQGIDRAIAAEVIKHHHYLHSFPGGTKLSLGVFDRKRLSGALTLGVRPKNAHCLVENTSADDCLTLTRLWLSDDLPSNSESRVLAMVVKLLRKHTTIKFLLSYADPSSGHVGTIYQAAGWLYIGLSAAMSLYDLGDGVARHSRSVGQIFGSHSIAHLTKNGINVKTIPQSPKYRYVCFVDPAWQSRLRVPVLPYPKKEKSDGSN